MIPEAVKDIVKVLITLALIMASAGIGNALAMGGLFVLIICLPEMTGVQNLSLGLLMIATAAWIWASFAGWLAWCSGRIRQFSVRTVFLALNLVAIYFGLIATYMSH